MQKGKDRRLKTTFDFPLPNKEEEEEYREATQNDARDSGIKVSDLQPTNWR